MAIGRDVSAKATSTGTSTTITGLAIAASATLIIGAVGFRGILDTLTGLTWAGGAMTFLTKVTNPVGAGFIYMYYTISPTTGSQNMVVNLSANATAADLDLYAESFTGTALTFPNASNTNTSTGAGPVTITTTPTVAGCWSIMLGENENNTLTASTGSTLVQNAHGSGLFDSNGTITSGVGYNMQATYGAGNNWCAIQAIIEPAAGAATVSFARNLSLLGVGQ